MTLADKHRPHALADVVGQDSTVAALRAMLSRGFSGGAVYLTGASGTGKTSIARALCSELGIADMDLTMCPGADCSVEFVRASILNFGLSTWGESGWKAIIVDEAHGITPKAVQAFLPFLESLPKKRLVIFTSTSLQTDLYGEYAGPFASRCITFALDLNTDAAADHVARIAGAENLNGQPIDAYRKLIADCEGNIRAALMRVESGVMLKRENAIPANPGPVARVSAPIPSNQADIEAELAYGAKLCTGSRKHKLHLERLAALTGGAQ